MALVMIQTMKQIDEYIINPFIYFVNCQTGVATKIINQKREDTNHETNRRSSNNP